MRIVSDSIYDCRFSMHTEVRHCVKHYART